MAENSTARAHPTRNPPLSCVALDKLRPFSEPPVLACKMGQQGSCGDGGQGTGGWPSCSLQVRARGQPSAHFTLEGLRPLPESPHLAHGKALPTAAPLMLGGLAPSLCSSPCAPPAT